MSLNPEHRIRGIGWCLATALHVCAGVLILRAASWGDGAIRAPSDHRGVVMLTLVRPDAAAPAASGAPLPPLSTSAPPLVEPSTAAAAGASAVAAAPTPPAPDAQGLPAAGTAAASDLSGADADRFRQALLAQIARYKQYPPDALRERIQGTVWVRFLVDRDGRLLRAWIDQSSGQSILDDEALAAIRRAAPFPAIPAGLPDKVDLTLGIPFTLG
jgi:protein TonB